ncbi:MAG TPA: type VI secretion system protein TssA, partial [Pyrinomonadaceae bacterium]|nr:type VI secretion system protein TssA [Pyrinomonadaceae bacterium]
VELYGFAGLRDGLRVMRGFHEQYWDNSYPEIEDGDMEARANALALMDRQLSVPIKEIPLTKSGSGIDYSYLQWEDSTKFDIPENLDTLDQEAYNRFSALKEQAEAEGKTTGDAWRKAKGASRRAFYEELYALINECWQEFQALDRVMDEKFQRQTPGLGALKKSLEDIRSLVEKLVKEKRILEPDPVSGGGDGADGEVGVAGEAGVAGGRGLSGPVRSRADALRRLEEVAGYFQQTEPHSPVAYLVQRAIKWGQMPLEVWLMDVIKDSNVLGQLRETLGLNTNVNGDDQSS